MKPYSCNHRFILVFISVLVTFTFGFYNRFKLVYVPKVRAGTSLALNRILFASDEIVETLDGHMLVYLKYDDYRCQHLYKVLQLSAGDTFKAGVLGKGMTDEAKIMTIDGSLARISVSQRDINISKAALKSKGVVKASIDKKKARLS